MDNFFSVSVLCFTTMPEKKMGSPYSLFSEAEVETTVFFAGYCVSIANPRVHHCKPLQQTNCICNIFQKPPEPSWSISLWIEKEKNGVTMLVFAKWTKLLQKMSLIFFSSLQLRILSERQLFWVQPLRSIYCEELQRWRRGEEFHGS